MTTDRQWLRPATAAEKFDVSERTLARWAKAGLIGHSKKDGVVWLNAGDIADVQAHGAVARTVIPIGAVAVRPAPADDWRSDPFWSNAR